jgi:hypothetical protein
MLTVSFTCRVLDAIYMMLYMVAFHLKPKDSELVQVVRLVSQQFSRFATFWNPCHHL